MGLDDNALSSIARVSVVGTADVALQDQTTNPVIVKFNKVHNSTTLTAATSKDDKTITVASTTGIIDGSYIILFNPTEERFYFGTAIGAPVGSVVTVDTPLDFEFPIGTYVDVAITNMAVDGSSTTQIFGLRGTSAPPGVDVKVDITRLIFTMVTDSPISLSKFGDLAKLTNGVVLRKRDGIFNNIFNVKNNREIVNLMFDFNASASTNPAQGEDGFVSRLTFAGQNKIGVVIRLPVGEDLEILIQDNLLAAQSTAQILIFEIYAEGHIVED